MSPRGQRALAFGRPGDPSCPPRLSCVGHSTGKGGRRLTRPTRRELTFPGGEAERSRFEITLAFPGREDITYRLPELDQRGSDEENLDSETSASTESLLEERGA